MIFFLAAVENFVEGNDVAGAIVDDGKGVPLPLDYLCLI